MQTETNKSDKTIISGPLRLVLLILALMGLAAAMLLVLGELDTGISPRGWTWVLYLVGCLVLFVVYIMKRRRVDAQGRAEYHEHQVRPDSDQSQESEANIMEIRRRIQERKKGGNKRSHS